MVHRIWSKCHALLSMTYSQGAFHCHLRNPMPSSTSWGSWYGGSSEDPPFFLYLMRAILHVALTNSGQMHMKKVILFWERCINSGLDATSCRKFRTTTFACNAQKCVSRWRRCRWIYKKNSVCSVYEALVAERFGTIRADLFIFILKRTRYTGIRKNGMEGEERKKNGM